MTQNSAFKAWLDEVNEIVLDACDHGINDIPDYNYWDSYSAGFSAEETAKKALVNVGFSF